MTPHNERPSDDPLEALLAAAGRNAPAPDAAFLAALRERSTEAFVAAAAPAPMSLSRRRPMVAFLSRTLSAAAALLVLVGGFLYWQSFVSPPTFGRIVQRLSEAESLHLRVVRGDQTSEVWVSQPHRWRWEESPEHYRLGDHARAWVVDEKANRAAPESSPWFDGVQPRLNVWAMLGLPRDSALEQQRPVRQEQRDDRAYFVYQLDFEPPAGGGVWGKTTVEALVDVETRFLHALETKAVQGPGAISLTALTVLAFNEQVPEDKLLVKETLSEDGRVGKVTDVQGITFVKPMTAERWTPVTTGLLLKPGDWLRTDPRGANAIACRLLKQTSVIVGPGTVLEVISPTQLRLGEGEVELTVPEGSVELLGPAGQKLALKGKSHQRLDRQKLVAVATEPLWLKGFKGTTANESLGSLIANVDGRNVPLTVGYHKVTVDIRDQIARTTIEESFINQTDVTLEGVFHFPLPQDASISGFGMWIGNELVMADVVEKQRAREIYETILRERRDPGLLEWTGGNIFKARVFPITGNSEKRIKIVYTQVLPLRGNRYRYSYALQSELLKQHPLKELALDVRLSSALPLKSVTCPTHPTRAEKTTNSARVEFTAQQYTPTRDFEVVVEVDGQQSDVVLIPHRRAADGYFMLQLTPPAPAGDWDRPVLAGSQPLQLLLVADTSASMDAGQRAQQADLVAALLGSLTPRDTINVACCDVECDWLFEKPVPADAKNAAAIRQFLAQRTSLGWTDLDKAFESVWRTAGLAPAGGPPTHVIYIGDGTVTTRDADPVAFGKRLQRMSDSSPRHKHGLSFHAVAVGSSYEPAALKAIGAIGGGSFRRVTTERGPQATALELLYEITQPVLRDLKVEFQGLRAARVYPEELPNLSPGTQQIILGRYLPEGGDQEGEVIVSGMRGGQPLTYRRKISLRDAEQGNSFIPRLWARQHLDHLLQQGSSPSVREDIIALSEEYQIITPYTSFLVLETDADRKRFAVKRSFRMRDGEKFFQEGLDRGRFELAQKQMKRAGAWRLGLQRQALRQFATLGRNPRAVQQYLHLVDDFKASSEPIEWLGDFGGTGYINGTNLGELRKEAFEPANFTRASGLSDETQIIWEMESGLDRVQGKLLDRLGIEQELASKRDEVGEGLPAGSPEPQAPAGLERELDEAREEPLVAKPRVPFGFADWDGPFLRRSLADAEDLYFRTKDAGEYGDGEYFGRRSRRYDPTSTLVNLFPQLPAPVKPVERLPVSTWSEAARVLARSLLRTEKLARLAGGIEVVQRHEYLDTRWGELSSQARSFALYSPTSWLVRTEGDGTDTRINWCDKTERGVWSRPFQLGRVRKAVPLDLSTIPFSLHDYSLTSLEESHPGSSVSVEQPAKDRVLLVMKYQHDTRSEYRVLIDTTRHVILSYEYRSDGKVVTTTRFDDFIEVAGCWWARKLETTDAQGRVSHRVTLAVRALAAPVFAQQVKDELSGRERVLFARQPLPRLADAKKAVSAGKATFEDHYLLLLHFARSQQWTRVRDQLEQCAKLAGGKPGFHWLSDGVLYVSRRHDELRKRVLEVADRLAQGPPSTVPGDDLTLAAHLHSQSGNVLEINERLAVMATLRPVYERQPKHTQAMKTWRQHYVNALLHAGRADESRKAYQQLAINYARDYNIQQGYAQTLFGAGEYDAAYAWLKRVLVKESRWTPPEEESLRNTYTNFLQQQGRFPELVDYLEGWIKSTPEGMSPYQQYLSALVRADQLDKANAVLALWLREGLADEQTPAAAARLRAAVNHALGSGHNLHTDRPDERWFAPLAALVRKHARHKTLGETASTIMHHGHFQRTDECRNLRRTFTGVLISEMETLSPASVQRFIGWIWPNDPAVEAEVWRKVAAGLRKRWTAEKEAEAKNTLGYSLQQVYRGRLAAEELLAFLRLQVTEGPEDYRMSYRGMLFNTLLQQPWKAEYENEAFTLLGTLSDSKDEYARLSNAVEALHRLTDRMVQARYDALMKLLEHPEKLTRTELRVKQDEYRKTARTGFAERLVQELAAITAGRQKPDFSVKAWTAWLTLERVYLDVLLDRNLDEVARACWQNLGEVPQPRKADEEPTTEHLLTALLRGRCLTTLGYLATRRDAKAELTDRLLTFLEKAQATSDEDGGWKNLRYRLLIALDRPKDLEKALQEWIRADDPDNRWRLSLGYVLAEQGRIQEAIRLFEGVEFGDELGPTAYRALADWYLVANRRDDHERALLQTYRTMNENVLQQILRAKLNPWLRNDRFLPSELEKDVLLIFTVLFEKSTYPANYVYQIQQFYDNSRDFRLLAVLADGVLGHSAAKVYPFLNTLQSVLNSIHEEATADSLFEHLAGLRKRAQTDVDHRALDLLEVLVRRRAAEIKNQPGPHVEAALTALQRAFKRAWSAGEPRLMADFLANLGAISREPLAKEQLRQLEALHTLAARGSFDRLHIAHRVANTYWAYGRRDPAADLLQAALREFQEANAGILPVSAQSALDTYIGYLENLRHFARGEKALLAHLQRPLHQQQTYWLTLRLYQLYDTALGGGGEVSLGAGQTLYATLHKRIQDDLGTPDQNHRSALVHRLCTVYRTAHRQQLSGVSADLREFAFKRLPHTLEAQTNQYTNLVSTVAQTLHDVAGPRDGLAFLIERIEHEPAWFRYGNQEGWNQHGGTLAYWRTQVKDLGALEPRLLKLVTTALRRDLEAQRAHHRSMYYRHNSYFWAEKAADFVRVAEEVHTQRGQSGAAVQYIAEYLYNGLGQHARAIAMLFLAHTKKLLDEAGQARLVVYLHEQNRHQESIPLLRPLVALRPDNLSYRTQLLHAYFRTKQQGELLALLRATEAHFRKPGKWTEQVSATLAHSCLTNELYEQCVGYYHEAIPLHQRTHPNRGIGNGTLSSYYTHLSTAYAALRKTPEAVDAASGAIVSWGPDLNHRAQALRALRNVLSTSPDLDGYVAHLDAETAKTGRDSPIIRKAVGQVYLEKNNYAKAVTQLRLAQELQPNDREIHDSLVNCYDRQNDTQGAVQQVLHALQLSRRDLNLYRDLGHRLTALKQPKEAERAYTSIVEMQAHESESHTMLALVRQQQNRWPDAIEHWQRVAEIRALEPTGLIRLVEALIHEKKWEKAAGTVKKLRAKSWPKRFDEEIATVRALEKRIGERK